MIKLLTTLLGIYLCCQNTPLNAQTTFAPPGAVWHYGSTKDDSRYLRYWVEKDTVILNQNCTKISGMDILWTNDSLPLPPQFVYTSSDTVFCYSDTFSRFQPLYLFNVKAGDTLIYHVPYLNPYLRHYPDSHTGRDTLIPFIVTKVDTLFVNGESLRRVWIDQRGTWYFLEGYYMEKIGSFYHNLNPLPMGNAMYTSPHHLRCYQDNSTFHTTNESISCDYLASPASAPEFWVYPNPNDGKFTIKSSEPISENSTFVLRDASGHLIDQWSSTTDELEIYYHSVPLNPGVYFLGIYTKRKHYYYLQIVVMP